MLLKELACLEEERKKRQSIKVQKQHSIHASLARTMRRAAATEGEDDYQHDQEETSRTVGQMAQYYMTKAKSAIGLGGKTGHDRFPVD